MKLNYGYNNYLPGKAIGNFNQNNFSQNDYLAKFFKSNKFKNALSQGDFFPSFDSFIDVLRVHNSKHSHIIHFKLKF